MHCNDRSEYKIWHVMEYYFPFHLQSPPSRRDDFPSPSVHSMRIGEREGVSLSSFVSGPWITIARILGYVKK